MRRLRFQSKLAQLIVAVVVLGVAAWLQYGSDDARDGSSSSETVPRGAPRTPGLVEEAFEARRSNVLVTDRGRVVRLLEDDNDGSRHQRFVLELDSGLTVLVAHNIDLAPRVRNLGVGEQIVFHGEYEWNDLGGVIHWTHHDPQGVHEDGWLEHSGIRYD